MEHKIKMLMEAITNERLKKLIESHVRELALDEETKHLVIFVDNVAPLHEIGSKEMDEHLRKGLEKIYDPDITYELKSYREHQMHEGEKEIPHEVHETVEKKRHDIQKEKSQQFPGQIT